MWNIWQNTPCNGSETIYKLISKVFFCVFFVVVETHKLMPTKDLPTYLVKQKKNKG